MDTSIATQTLVTLRQQTPAPLVIDVRREAVFKTAPDLIAGAVRQDPATIGEWAGKIRNNALVVVYCVHGHEVSQNAAKVLRERGLNAKFLEGGIEAWRAAGGDLAANANTGPQEPA